MREISGEEDMSTWGMHVFGNQKVPPPLAFPGLGSCAILQSFMNNELNSLFELDSDKGDLFLEGLLANGWLSKLAFICGCVEKSMAMWTFNLMLYSPKEELRTSACEFWCAILSSKDEVILILFCFLEANLIVIYIGEVQRVIFYWHSLSLSTLTFDLVDLQPVLIDWLPSYFELKGALEIYGFQSKSSFNRDSLHAGSNCGGPPQNIRSWVRFAAACSHVRNKFSVLSTSEAEELVEVIIFLFLDHQLHGLAVLLYECMQSLISYFTEKEWKNSCNKIAKSLACRVPKDLNCLRAVECISGYDTRSKQLRSSVAYQILLVCFDNKATDEEEVMRLLIAINVKEKGCDLFKMYIYLVLAENWLLVNQMLEHKPVINEMWGLYLRNCSCQISSTDLRSFASKVRNKASYLLQGTVTK
ncbi:hypothetical protein I3843_13G107900 [Carya illinoinensis]|nr:hypothetical protein I3843_13G107900 [Carya illinoinensis]